MPLNVRRLSAIVSLVLIFVFGAFAQNPTSADVMRSRISKAKAFVAIKNYAAAIYELEGIKRETNDPTVNGVVQVMLMNCYLEQLDYKRAQSLLTEIYNAQKANKPNSNYFAVAGQVVKSAKSQLERYKSLGLSVSDRNLPSEAVADVEKMRETVETVIEHSKTLSENKKLTADSMALLEEAGTARSNLGRDDYDARRWKDEVADAREKMMATRTTIINSVNDGTPNTIDASKTLATNNAPIITMSPETPTKIVPVSNQNSTNQTVQPAGNQTVAKKEENIVTPPKTVTNSEAIVKKTVIEVAKDEEKETNNNVAQNTPNRERLIIGNQKNEAEPKVETNNSETTASNTVKSDEPLQMGSLIEYATAKVAPTYPPAAKTMRMTGTVKVEVVINEDGSIAEVQKTSGPSMLQRAAVDALKKWKFKPFVRDGQAVKAFGYVSFNFNL